MKIIEGKITSSDARFVLIASRFNEFIVDQLVKGAVDALKRHGIDDKNLCLVKVPGAFEIPLVARTLAQTGKYDAIIALGAVIRGQTAHFDYVAGSCNRGLAAVSAELAIPVANGVLTVNSLEQAIERAGTKAGNKGADAALTAMEMVDLIKQLKP